MFYSTGNTHLTIDGKTWRTALLATVSLLSFGSTFAAQAQAQAQTPPAPAAAEEVPGDIVVTATRRAVSASNVGISLSAISGAALEQQHLDGQRDLLISVPGIAFAEKGTGQSAISLRGVASDPGSSFGSNAINGNATVGIYLDETSIALSGFNPEPRLFDINRVEVLRGPQGTLFGAGSLSGTLRYISNAPVLGKVEGRASGDVSTTAHGSESYELNGMINLPVGDTLALRLVAYGRDIGGFIDNVANRDDVRSVDYGDPIRKDVDYDHTYGGRLQGLWEPTDAFKVNGRLYYQNTRTGGVPTVDRANPINPNDALLGDYEQSRLAKEGLNARFFVANLEVNYDLGPAVLTSSSSYLNSRSSAGYEDTDVFRLFFDPSFQADPNVPIGGTGALITSTVHSKQLTQEFRLSSDTDGPLSYVAGLFFNKTDNDIFVYGPFPGFGDSIAGFDSLQEALASLPFFPGLSPDPLDLDNSVRYKFERRQKQYAAFGELTYKLNDMLSVIGGGRYYHYTYTQTIPYKYGAVVDPNTDPGRIKESGFNPKGSVEIRPLGDGRLLAYITASKGFRLGGFRDAVPEACGASASGFKSDSVWNYEIGSKFKIGRIGQINAALYRTDWSKIPTARQFACGFTAIENAGNARVKGFETDAAFLVAPGLQLSGNFSYTDAKYRNTSGDGSITAGTVLALVPKYTAGAAASYTRPVTETLRATASFNFSYRSPVYHSAAADRVKLPHYSVVGLRAGLETDAWSAAVYVQNLFDKYAVTYKETSFLFENRDTLLRPRTIGLNVSYKY